MAPAIIGGAEMIDFESPVEVDAPAVDGLDKAFLRLAGVLAVGAVGGGDDDAVADAPAGDWLGELDAGGAGLDGVAEADPGAVHGRAVEVHAAGAAHDRRARFLVHTFEVDETDESVLAGLYGSLG
jgi:hypothetical protein